MQIWIACILTFVASGGIACVAPYPACWLMVVCWIAAIGSCYPLLPGSPHFRSKPKSARALATVASLAAVVWCVPLSLAWFARVREYAKCSVTLSNLRGIGQGMRVYSDQFHGYPTSAEELVRTDVSTWGQFISVGDPDVPYEQFRGRDPEYSSFRIVPGTGLWRDEPDVLLAFERESWTLIEARIFPEYGRCVLRGDGAVQVLSESQFAEAKQRDAARRGELGWEVTP